MRFLSSERFVRLLACTAAALSACVMQAANTHVLEIDNGERLLGELLGINDDKIHFRSEVIGEVFVAVGRAKVHPIAEEDAQGSLQKAGWSRVATDPVARPAAAEVPVAKAAPANDPPASSAGHREQPPDSPRASRWRHLLEVGYGLQSSKVSKSDIYFRGELVRTHEDYAYKIYGKYLYGEQEHVPNVNKIEAGLNIRHQLAGRWEVRNEFYYQNDQLRLLDLEMTGVAGVSYAIIKGPRVHFRLGPGVGVRYREPEIGKTGYTFSGDFSGEFGWKITDRIKLAQNGSVLGDPNHPDNYRLRSAAVATGKLSEQLSVNLRYEYEFDHARPVLVQRADQRVFTTFGYTF